jgi:hypothetical protein
MAQIGIMSMGQLKHERSGDVVFERGKKAVPLSESRVKIHEKLTVRKANYMEKLADGYVTTKNLNDQWKWHGMFRDTANMMYRTSYLDHTNAREIACKSTHPSGYGGHVMRQRHDILFKNTDFDVVEDDMITDEKRERLPDFETQLLGLPTTTREPRGARKVPLYKTSPVSSVLAMREPWASTGISTHAVLSFRDDVPILPKQRPYDLPPLHPSGAVTERGPRRAKTQDVVQLSEAPAEPEPDAQPEEVVVPEKPRRKVFVSAPTTLPDASVADLATTAQVLTASLVTPRSYPANKVDAQELSSALGPYRMHMVSTTRASYVLTDAKPSPRKPSLSPRLPAVSPRASP